MEKGKDIQWLEFNIRKHHHLGYFQYKWLLVFNPK